MSTDRFVMPPDLLLDTLIRHGTEIMLIVEPASQRIVACNPAACAVLGYSPDEFEGMGILDVECSIHDVFYWDEAARGSPRQLERVEGLHRCRDGRVIPVKKNLKTLDCLGTPLLVLTARDISDRKTIEDLLAEKTSQLAATLESTADGICVMDLDGHISNFNRRFVDIWAIPEALLEGHHDAAILACMSGQTRDPEAYQRRLEDICRDPASDVFDVIELKDGRVFERGVKPMHLAEQPVGRVYSYSDITVRVNAERDAIVARDAAQKASQAKSDFLSQMSHELRTPLNAILGFTQILEAEAPPEQAEMIRHVASAGWHLLDLINDVLDLARIEAGKLDVDRQPVEVDAVLGEALALIRPLADRQEVTLEPGGPAALSVAADALRLKQVLINLLSNAVKYNRPGGRVTIVIGTARGRLRIAVEDTGVGMTADELARLFTPFTRLGGYPRVEGTGIGLYLTRELVRLMGGTLDVVSEPGVGSVFAVELPLIEPEAAAPAPVAAPAFARDGLRHVLYVEDDPVSVVLMQEVFKRLPGTRLAIAGDARRGLELADATPPDLILLDVNLPGMSGLELVREFRRRPATAGLQIFAFSANALAADVEKGLEAGFDAYLTKPLQIAVLTEKLQQALHGRQR